MSVILRNGSKAERIKSSDGCTVLPCGCAHTDVMWVQMCEEHDKEDNDLHQAAIANHRSPEKQNGEA